VHPQGGCQPHAFVDLDGPVSPRSGCSSGSGGRGKGNNLWLMGEIIKVKESKL
jgi:hypothetical protein